MFNTSKAKMMWLFGKWMAANRVELLCRGFNERVFPTEEVVDLHKEAINEHTSPTPEPGTEPEPTKTLKDKLLDKWPWKK